MKNFSKYIEEAFKAKKAIKTGNLEKSDLVHVDAIKKYGGTIDDFIITSTGYELKIKSKKRDYKVVGKTPTDAIKRADKEL